MGKLKSLDLSSKKELIDQSERKTLSVLQQCTLLEYTRSNLSYRPKLNKTRETIKDEIVSIFE